MATTISSALTYVMYGLGITAVGMAGTITYIKVAEELDRSTPASVGNNLRSDGHVPAVAASAVSLGAVNPSDFNINTYNGKVVNVTSPAELAALSPSVSGADAMYGTPSRLNPVPVRIPPLSPDYYPSVSPGTKFSGSRNGVYNYSSTGLSGNPDNLSYVTSDTASGLLDFYISGSASVVERYYNQLAKEYKSLSDSCNLCMAGGVVELGGYRKVYTLIRLDDFSFPDISKSVTDSDARQAYNINGSIVSLPSLSYLSAFIPPLTLYNIYKEEEYRMINDVYYLQSSVVRSRTVEFPGFTFLNTTVNPSSELTVKDNTGSKGAVIIPPLYTQPDYVQELQNRPLSSSQVSSMINAAWQRASSRADYRGIPYSSSVAVTATMVDEILEARNMALTTADLLVPVSKTGYWDLPVYNITLNQFVSNTYIEQVPELDFGINPDIQAPVLPAPLPMDVILLPITSILPFMKDIHLRSRAAQCPVFDLNIEYLNFSQRVESHCFILDKQAPLIEMFAVIAWTMMSLFIVIRRRV
ncbi:hypothetical protein [Citrobacter meridianamericanus]|uniref:hypothetical protein n=1 Tax=Citrobacter meridianamericanus TaxID=2894201 RepID=UPI00351D87B9